MEADVRLVHLRMKRVPSRTKSLGRSASSWTVSDMVGEVKEGGEREVKRRGRAYRVGERAVIDSRDNLAFRGPEHRVSPLRRCVQHQTELSPLSSSSLLFLSSLPLPLLSFSVLFFSLASSSLPELELSALLVLAFRRHTTPAPSGYNLELLYSPGLTSWRGDSTNCVIFPLSIVSSDLAACTSGSSPFSVEPSHLPGCGRKLVTPPLCG